MRHVRTTHANIDFFSESEFAEFRQTLDGKMKWLQSKGIGGHVKKAEAITEEEEEEMLWTQGLLAW